MTKKMAGNLQPLVNNQRIVKDDGTPTDYFIRWAQQKQIDIGQGITAEQAVQIITQYLADHELQAGSGIQITPSGNLSDTPTIAAEVQAILDQITTTQGSILFRGAAGWEALAPGTSGQFLKTNGAGADPSWAAGGGGGGGGGWANLDYYDASVSGATAGRTVDVSSYDEVMIIFDLVTLAASGWRVIQVSVDGGVSWLTSSSDYSTLTNTGTISSADTAIFSHSTANAGARSATVTISPLRSTYLPKTAFCPVRNAQEHINTASAITHIRCIGWTSGQAITNMTGGKIAVYGR